MGAVMFRGWEWEDALHGHPKPGGPFVLVAQGLFVIL